MSSIWFYEYKYLLKIRPAVGKKIAGQVFPCICKINIMPIFLELFAKFAKPRIPSDFGHTRNHLTHHSHPSHSLHRANLSGLSANLERAVARCSDFGQSLAEQSRSHIFDKFSLVWRKSRNLLKLKEKFHLSILPGNFFSWYAVTVTLV